MALSTPARLLELPEKLAFYDRYGVEECYVVYPETDTVDVYLRKDGALHKMAFNGVFDSPALGVRFISHDGPLRVLLPDGSPMLSLADHRRELDALLAKQDRT